MKTETKKRIYAEAINQLNNGNPAGKNFKLEFFANGDPCLAIFNGTRWRLDDHKEVVQNLTDVGKSVIAVEKKKFEAWQDRCRQEAEREQRELEARMDEPGFTLLAGENTDVVHKGTLRECRENLWQITHYPRYSNGIGCWVIVDSENHEVMEGKFDRDCYY